MFHEQIKPKTYLVRDKTKESERMLPLVYCDLDQVLADFLGAAERVLGKPYTSEKMHVLEENEPNFYRDLEWFEGGNDLWKYISKFEVEILSAVPKSSMPNAKRNKNEWINEHLGTEVRRNLVKRHEKKNFAVSEKGQPNLLIDDYLKNVSEWQKEGGVAIHHTSLENTISKLQNMGFQ